MKAIGDEIIRVTKGGKGDVKALMVKQEEVKAIYKNDWQPLPKWTYEPEYIPTPIYEEKQNLNIKSNEALFTVEATKEC